MDYRFTKIPAYLFQEKSLMLKLRLRFFKPKTVISHFLRHLINLINLRNFYTFSMFFWLNPRTFSPKNVLILDKIDNLSKKYRIVLNHIQFFGIIYLFEYTAHLRRFHL